MNDSIPEDLAKARGMLEAARKALQATPSEQLAPYAARLQRMEAEVARIERVYEIAASSSARN